MILHIAKKSIQLSVVRGLANWFWTVLPYRKTWMQFYFLHSRSRLSSSQSVSRLQTNVVAKESYFGPSVHMSCIWKRRQFCKSAHHAQTRRPIFTKHGRKIGICNFNGLYEIWNRVCWQWSGNFQRMIYAITLYKLQQIQKFFLHLEEFACKWIIWVFIFDKNMVRSLQRSELYNNFGNLRTIFKYPFAYEKVFLLSVCWTSWYVNVIHYFNADFSKIF